MGAHEATAAVGAAVGAVGAVTHNKGLQIAGMGLGLVGGVGALASSAGLLGADALGGVTAGAAAGSDVGGAFTTAESAAMGNAAGLGTDAAGFAASGPGTVTDIIDSIVSPANSGAAGEAANTTITSAAAPTASPAANAASPNVTPAAATDTPYTGPQGDIGDNESPGDIARKAGNAAGGAPPGSLPMPTAQSPSPMTPDEVLAAGGWPPAWTANTNSLGPPAGALSSPPPAAPTAAAPSAPQFSNSAPSSISFPATPAAGPSVPGVSPVPGVPPVTGAVPPFNPQSLLNSQAADLAAQQGQGLTAGMTPAGSGGPPSMFDNLLKFATNPGGGRLLGGVIQAGSAFIAGATSTLTPAQVAALNAQANANQAAATSPIGSSQT